MVNSVAVHSKYSTQRKLLLCASHFHVSNVHKYKILSIRNHTSVCGSKSFLTTSRLCCCHGFYFIKVIHLQSLKKGYTVPQSVY